MICVICTIFKRICDLQKQLFSLASGLKGSVSGLIHYHHLISLSATCAPYSDKAFFIRALEVLGNNVISG